LLRAEKRITRLISIEKLEEFARIVDEGIDTTELEKLAFLKRIPLGIYCFSILESSEIQDDPINKNYEVLLYDDTEQPYDDFINDLEYLFETVDIGERENLSDQELNYLFNKVKGEYFLDHEALIGYRDEDVANILRYYAQNETKPYFLAFKDRQQCNLAKVAAHIYKTSLGGKAKTKYVNDLWEDAQAFWQVLFSYDKKYFLRQLDIEIHKIEYPEEYQQNIATVTVIYDEKDIHSLPLSEIKERDFGYYQQLRDTVYAKHTDPNGFITCAIDGFKSKRRIDFQIDHVKPMAEGGLSTLDNLQVLSRKAHAEKTRQQNMRSQTTIVR